MNAIHGYDANPYEIEARYRESDFCKSNYTFCVRNGLAKTVHNPNFRNGHKWEQKIFSNRFDLIIPLGNAAILFIFLPDLKIFWLFAVI